MPIFLLSQFLVPFDEEIFNSLYNTFIDMSDYKALETILSYKNLYYPTSSKKEILLNEMEALFEADGDFSNIEKGLLNFLDKLM